METEPKGRLVAHLDDWWLSPPTQRLTGYYSRTLDSDTRPGWLHITSPVLELNREHGYAITEDTHYILGHENPTGKYK